MKRRNFFGSLAALMAVPFVKLEVEKPKESIQTFIAKNEEWCKADFCNDRLVLQKCEYRPYQGVSRVYLYNIDDMKEISFEAKGNWLNYPEVS